MYGIHSHHNPNEANYQVHIACINGNDYCLGCLSSKIFLLVLLPILHLVFILPAYGYTITLIEILMVLLWILNVVIFAVELKTGVGLNRFSFKFITTSYFLTSILYTASKVSYFSSSISLSLAFLLAAPQITIYFLKIITRKEFTRKKIKFLSRLSFITGFFFTLVNFQINYLANSIFILLGIIIFTKLRAFSNYRVNPDKVLASIYTIGGTSLQSKFMSKFEIFDEKGLVDLKGKREKKLLTQFWINLILAVLFTLGFIVVASYEQAGICSSQIPTKSLSTSLPFIAMSGKTPNFCSNCGTKLEGDDKFCAACGFEIGKPKVSQPSPQTRPPNYPPSQTGSLGYAGSQPYQRTGQQRRTGRKDENRSTAITIGIIVVVMVTLITGNIIFGLIMGVVAYFGTQLAQSTDDPCLSYCIMSSLCDCICSATQAETGRRGRF